MSIWNSLCLRVTCRIPNADVEDIDDLTLEPEISPPKQAGREADEAAGLAAARKLKVPLEQALEKFYGALKEK